MPSWKKLITSGSDASLNSLNVITAVSSSAFSGSYFGDGANLDNVRLFISGIDLESNPVAATFSKLHFDSTTGIYVSASDADTAFVELGSHFRDIFVEGYPTLVATGSDQLDVIAGKGISISSSLTDTNSNSVSKELIFAIDASVATTGSNVLNGSQTVNGNISASGDITASGLLVNDFAVNDTLTIGSQKFYAQGNNGFSVNEDFDPSNSSLQTAYHFTSGTGRETVAFTLARTGQFTDGFGIYGTSSDNTFVMFGEQTNTSFEWRKGVGIQPLDLDGGTLLAKIDKDGNLTVTGTANIQTALTASNAVLSGDLTVGGKVTAQEFHTEFVSASIIYQSGSTKFGDTSDDVHSFSGSLRITGSGDHYFSDGNVGIGTTSPSTKLEVNGTATVTALVETSTRELKKDITELEDQSLIVDSLQPVTYTWKESEEEDFGLIAEDVAKIVPHLVQRNSEGKPSGIKYSKLSVLLLDVVQRQSTLIEDLNKRITKLENERG